MIMSSSSLSRFMKSETDSIEWKISKTPVPYMEALSFMEERVELIHKGEASELIWFLEHPPLYTLGTSGQEKDILREDVPAFKTGRGGQATFHGPGQRVAYLMLDLSKRNKDLKAYIWCLEEALKNTLGDLGVPAERREGRVGLWVSPSFSSSLKVESKIAAIGVRVRRWVTYHGISLNVSPDLSYFQGIIPCGLNQYGVTSLKDLGLEVSFAKVDTLLQKHFQSLF